MGDVVFQLIDTHPHSRVVGVEPTLLRESSGEVPLLTAAQVEQVAGPRPVQIVGDAAPPWLLDAANGVLRARGVKRFV